MSFLPLAQAAADAIPSTGLPWWETTYTQYLGLNPLHVVLMMAPFWVTLFITWKLAVKPILMVIEEREHRTEGTRAEAAELEIKFNERLKAYEARLNETKVKATEERQRIRRVATAEEGVILGAAREDAAKKVEEVRSTVEAETKKVRADLGATAEALARELAEKALGRKIDGEGSTGAGGSRPSATGVRS